MKKHHDNPDPVTWVTFVLVTKLVKQGTIDRKQVLEIILKTSARIGVDAGASADAGPGASRIGPHEPACDAAAARPDSHHHPDTGPICRAVQLRLAALRDRIRAAGTAVLPPSRAVMGPPFVPALEFLRQLVVDAAASSPATMTAASADKDASAAVAAAPASGPHHAEAPEAYATVDCSEGEGGARKRPRSDP